MVNYIQTNGQETSIHIAQTLMILISSMVIIQVIKDHGIDLLYINATKQNDLWKENNAKINHK